MAEKIYQINSDQFGVVKFDKPWFLMHIEIVESNESVQLFFPNIELAFTNFPKEFENKVINKWKELGEIGKEKILELKKYLLDTWWNPGLESARIEMIKNFGRTDFENYSSEYLLNKDFEFMALAIAHILFHHNKMHFFFDGLHASIRFVDSFLAVNFWEKDE